MGTPQMAKAVGGEDIQEFPLSTAGKMRATSTSGAGGDGVFTGVKLIACREYGSINVVFADGTTKDAVIYDEGWGNSFPEGATITIVTGSFDLN